MPRTAASATLCCAADPDHHAPARHRLGFLLHKNPARAQSASVSTGTAHVFSPETDEDRCTAALLLEVDPVDPPL